jgi:hypothetical protein
MYKHVRPAKTVTYYNRQASLSPACATRLTDRSIQCIDNIWSWAPGPTDRPTDRRLQESRSSITLQSGVLLAPSLNYRDLSWTVGVLIFCSTVRLSTKLTVHLILSALLARVKAAVPWLVFLWCWSYKHLTSQTGTLWPFWPLCLLFMYVRNCFKCFFSASLAITSLTNTIKKSKQVKGMLSVL